MTGGSGFIGRRVVDRISRRHSVSVMDMRQPTAKVRFIMQDIRRPFRIGKETEVVVHLASVVGGIHYFSGHPGTHAHDNSLTLANTFEACVRSSVKRIIYASSSVVYQYARNFPTREDETIRIPPPSSAYGFTKLLGEKFCHSYKEQYGLDYTVLRPFNAYGPGEDPDPDHAHVIPQLGGKVLSGQRPVEIYGSGNQTRCFTYVDDIARAFQMSLDSPAARGETFNVSSDEEVRIIELLEAIWKLTWQSRPLMVKRLPALPDDVGRRHASTARIRAILGWTPRVKLNDGLRRTLAWLKTRSMSTKGAW